MAPKDTILRFPQTRKKSAYVIVQAVSTGRHPLDLRLSGTDSLEAFGATRKSPESRPHGIPLLRSRGPCRLRLCITFAVG